MAPGRTDFHLGLATNDLEAAMTTIGELFGHKWSRIVENPGVDQWTPSGPTTFTMRLANSRGAPFRIELLQGSPGSIWAVESGVALHHIGFQSGQFISELTALEADGWTIEQTLRDASGRPSFYAYLSRPGQARVEVVDSSPSHGGSHVR